MTRYSEKMMIFHGCIRGFMPNLHKNSWTVSTKQRSSIVTTAHFSHQIHQAYHKLCQASLNAEEGLNSGSGEANSLYCFVADPWHFTKVCTKLQFLNFLKCFSFNFQLWLKIVSCIESERNSLTTKKWRNLSATYKSFHVLIWIWVFSKWVSLRLGTRKCL